MSKEYTETWAEFLARYPNLAFIRTKKFITKAEEIDDNIVIEEDTLPLIKGLTRIIAIDETAYPRCFELGTAMEIGMWAIYNCERNGWEINSAFILGVLKMQEEALAREEEQKKGKK